ncbi:hypothetical protein CC78DRAFT_581871 [Lojkania enalia]|uniref:Uncharacterized protein n=1 Tax=Lojkania enalia TaxID=147567 RepID=A0A9P4K899_9PLEO|nr:hypothetical protein CC78DRAFT_581871 [Didymosphaeria enalia]
MTRPLLSSPPPSSALPPNDILPLPRTSVPSSTSTTRPHGIPPSLSYLYRHLTPSHPSPDISPHATRSNTNGVALQYPTPQHTTHDSSHIENIFAPQAHQHHHLPTASQYPITRADRSPDPMVPQTPSPSYDSLFPEFTNLSPRTSHPRQTIRPIASPQSQPSDPEQNPGLVDDPEPLPSHHTQNPIPVVPTSPQSQCSIPPPNIRPVARYPVWVCCVCTYTHRAIPTNSIPALPPSPKTQSRKLDTKYKTANSIPGHARMCSEQHHPENLSLCGNILCQHGYCEWCMTWRP